METIASAAAQHQLLSATRSKFARQLCMLAVLVTAISFAGVLSADVFINELHYDNSGADTGEAVEVAGSAGTNLAGWSIVLYNGSNSLSYSTINLSGTLSDQSAGFGTLSFTQAGIQNGSPDGLALVDPGANVVQFLSYEGAFTAADGPANGMTSTDIGVSEASSTPVGHSLQLTGSGTAYADFTWAGAQPNTFGAINTGQSFIAPVFINELHYDNASSDTGEAVEVAGSAGTNLAGWSIVLYNGSNSLSYNTINLSGTLSDQSAGFGTLSFTQAGIQNGSPDGLALVDPGANVVQFLSYEGAFTAADGPANGMTSTDIGVSEASSTPVGHSLQLTGSGTAYADFTWAGAQPSTFGAINTGQSFGGPVPGVVLINEADADTPGTDVLEFVELYDGGTGDTSLDGLTLVFYNGNGDVSYAAYDLDGYSTDSDGYFVLGNAAVTPAPSIIFGSNGLQNGADAVALYTADGTDFPNGTAVTTTDLLDALVYDTSDSDDAGLLVLLNAAQPQVNEGGAGDKDNHSNQRCANGSGGARNTDTYGQFTPTPAAVNCEAPPPPLEVCGDPTTFIHDIQGSGLASPLDGTPVSIEGIVVGDFQDGTAGSNGDLNGFFVQEEDADADGDPATSEGIFVFDGSSPAVNVENGDKVRVSGTVDEFNGMTDISRTTFIDVCIEDAGLPTAAEVTLPVASLDDFEKYEGMYVTLPQTLTITEYFNFDRFGEIVLSADRQFQPTAIFDPGSFDAATLAEMNALDRITLDDGRATQNPDPAIHPNGSEFDLNNLFRGGDLVEDVTGVMNFSFNLYRIQPTQGAVFTSANPRSVQPEPVGGNLKVASFNVLNYFSTLDDAGSICGPDENQGCRGADNATEFTRQRDKIISAISASGADVIGLMEIENHVDDEAVQDLVSGLNDANGTVTWDYVDSGVIGLDVIKVALIYQPAKASLLGSHAILDSSVDPRFSDALNRPALAQTFVDNFTGGVFTVAVNHLKSKGSDCDDVGDPDTGDGAGNCNLTRAEAAAALVDWLADDPTGSNDSDSIVIGDLNSYDKEDPIDVFIAAGYIDLAASFGGEFAYGYLFNGQSGYLDYALTNAGLSAQVTGATAWHINADEPDLIDYDTSFKKAAQDAIYAPDPYRSSDHDPMISGLDLLHYDFTGFFRPIDNVPELNKAKAGSSVPVKFSLSGYFGLEIFAPGYPRSHEIDCETGSPGTGAETMTAGGSSLSYDEETDQYNYVWKTEKEWARSCRQLIVQLNDGSYHYANFQFK